MPSKFDQLGAGQPPPTTPSKFDRLAPPSTATPGSRFDQLEEPDDSGPGWGTVGVIGAGAAAAAALALTHNPEVAARIGNELKDARAVSMLSGLAGLKSLLGNTGSMVYSSLEHGTTAPIREFFSPETATAFKDAWKAGATYEGGAPTIAQKANVFGRFMGSMDTAARGALERAGTHTADEAAIEMLQRPLPHTIDEALDSPVGRYLVPFRRTPFNQFSEGVRNLGDWSTTGKKIANAASVGQGMATGYTTDDPTATALSISAGGKRGMGVAAGDIVGRLLKGESANKAGQGMQGMSPVADTSLSKSVTQPFTDPLSMVKPAALSAIDKLMLMFGSK